MLYGIEQVQQTAYLSKGSFWLAAVGYCTSNIITFFALTEMRLILFLHAIENLQVQDVPWQKFL